MTKWHCERKPMASGSPGRPSPNAKVDRERRNGRQYFRPVWRIFPWEGLIGPAMLSASSPLADPDVRSYDDLVRSQVFGA